MRNAVRLGAVATLLLTGPHGAAQSVKRAHVRGFVVAIDSPTLLTVDDYRITEDKTYRVSLDAPVESIRIGTEVEIDALADAATGELHASSVIPRVAPFDAIKQLTIISQAPHDGLFNADGRRIRVGPSTRVVFGKGKQALTSLDEVTAGAILIYEASHREADGAIAADRVELRRNETESGERALTTTLDMHLKEPDFERHRSGGVRIYHGSRYYEIIADAEAQHYIAELGWRLVPEYQRDMPESDPTKISFKFYVVKRDEAGAVALPNGVVLVYSRLLDTVENEAQLAAVVGHEIAHVVQEHNWQLARKVDAAFGNVYSRAYENQADRLGLRYMVDAGYDPREAPRVWKLITKKFGFVQTNVFQGSHDNHALRREYLMSEIEQNYRDLDYAPLKTEEAPFARIARLVKGDVDPSWKEKNAR